jgi:iron(III) transport system substrate-binding protein
MVKDLSFLLGLVTVLWVGAPVQAGDLTVYYSWGDREAAAVLDAFEGSSGLSVDRMRRSSRTIIKILELERDAPVASVLMGGPISAYLMGVDAGLFEAYSPAGIESYPPELEDPNHVWHAIAAGVIGFGTDPSLAIEPPTSWDDLLDDRFRGRVVYGDPTTSGAGYTIVAALIGLYGEDEAYSYLARLDDNVSYYTEGGATAAHLARLGIGGVGIAFLHDLAGLTPRAGETRLILTVPEEGTGWELGCAALIADAPNREAGQQLLDFLLTPEAQELLWREVGLPMYPVHPDAISPPAVPPFDSFPRVPMNWESVSNAWDERARRWYTDVGSRTPGRE